MFDIHYTLQKKKVRSNYWWGLFQKYIQYYDRLIRLTSPNLNYLIIIGAVLLYLSTMGFFYPEGSSSTQIAWLCNVTFLVFCYVGTYMMKDCRVCNNSSIYMYVCCHSGYVNSFSLGSIPTVTSLTVCYCVHSICLLFFGTILQLRTVLSSLGGSICYGTIYMKMYRVFYICTKARKLSVVRKVQVTCSLQICGVGLTT